MKKIYADNSATSFPKAPGVSGAVKDFIDHVGCNVNRGGYAPAFDVALEILATRKQLCALFGFNQPRNVIFTPGATYSLNMILKGLLKEGEHVITTSMEHNAVMRPLHELSQKGVPYSVAPCRPDGSLDPEEIKKIITPRTKALVMTHASNVCGTVLPVSDIYELCKKHGIKLIIDAAQTAGILDLPMSCADAIAFTCHKGLLAPQGLGGFVIKNELAEKIEALITGGTGSQSHEIIQPGVLPDKFESGTLNIPAILGLQKALDYISRTGMPAIFAHEMKLTEHFLEGISKLNGVRIVGKNDTQGRIAVVSLDFAHRDNAEIASVLDRAYGIMTRCGLHCAPLAHKTLHTYPQGTLRFSFGHFNTPGDIDYILASIKEIIAE